MRKAGRASFEAPRWLIVVFVVCSAGVAAQTAESEPTPPIYYGFAATGLASERTLLPPTAPSPSQDLNTARASAMPRASWLRAQLIEVPRESTHGQYTRPRYALGFRSNTMRRWLKDLGMDAQSCLAPVVRLRTSISSDFDVSGTLWIHVRCSFY